MEDKFGVIGWTDAYTTSCPIALFSEGRKKALIERMKKRQYSFQHKDHEIMPYCAPYYNDGVICVLTREQWNDVMDSVYKDVPYAPRLLPMDVIESKPINGILYEKPKFAPQGE